MDMTVWKGGRGVKAPYKTTHVRIPVDIKPQVEELSRAFRDGQLNTMLSRDDAIEKARQLLKAKKGAKFCMEILLTAIYGNTIQL
jgi:hypothetical protein